jgi:MinD superfamily P-loop ATPase
MNGADLVLIVAEPSVSGISDLERIVKTASQFGLKTCVCINKWDTNPEKADAITSFCKGRGIPLAGRIPFDESVVRAVNAGQSITETNSAAGRAVRRYIKRA